LLQYPQFSFISKQFQNNFKTINKSKKRKEKKRKEKLKKKQQTAFHSRRKI